MCLQDPTLNVSCLACPVHRSRHQRINLLLITITGMLQLLLRCAANHCNSSRTVDIMTTESGAGSERLPPFYMEHKSSRYTLISMHRSPMGCLRPVFRITDITEIFS